MNGNKNEKINYIFSESHSCFLGRGVVCLLGRITRTRVNVPGERKSMLRTSRPDQETYIIPCTLLSTQFFRFLSSSPEPRRLVLFISTLLLFSSYPSIIQLFPSALYQFSNPPPFSHSMRDPAMILPLTSSFPFHSLPNLFLLLLVPFFLKSISQLRNQTRPDSISS